MLVSVKRPKPRAGFGHISHAVLLESCLPDSFRLRNSYPSDPIITIPRNRRTSYQNFIRDNSGKFRLSAETVEKKFEFHSGVKIEWDKPDELIIADTGYSMEFKLKNQIKYEKKGTRKQKGKQNGNRKGNRKSSVFKPSLLKI